ncbi:hypothetical protein MRX96_041714 [Rhipicephalus microplus]
MSGSRWFVSKSKETFARAKPQVPLLQVRSARTTPGLRGASKNSEGGHGQLVFRRQDRVKVKQRTPDGSPRRDDHKPPSCAPSKSRGRGDSKKPSGDDDLWSALGHVYNEVPAWALREVRERLTPAWVAKHQGYLRTSARGVPEALSAAPRCPR